MKCPRCGAEMNHHADKILPAEPSEPAFNAAFGGAILELHSCPACGAAASRRSATLE